MLINEVILVGVGSVGKTHFKYISQNFEKITLVDPKIHEIKRDLMLGLGNSITFKNTIYEISPVDASTLIVISNWGPNHFEVFKYFAKKGAKIFLIEKPLTDSLHELSIMRKFEKKYNLRIMTHIPVLYSKFTKYLESNSMKIGAPISINIFGGAKCVATNGIHYIALASKLFASRPRETGGYLHSELINPRNLSFKFYEGVADWQYPENRQLVVNFSNQSKINLKIEILFKYSKAEIYENTFTLTKLDETEIDNLHKPSITKYPTSLIYNGTAYEKNFESPETAEIYQRILDDSSHHVEDFGFGATEDLIAAIISNQEKRRIELPIKNTIKIRYSKRKWGIS
jgi:hypothetical protein